MRQIITLEGNSNGTSSTFRFCHVFGSFSYCNHCAASTEATTLRISIDIPNRQDRPSYEIEESSAASDYGCSESVFRCPDPERRSNGRHSAHQATAPLFVARVYYENFQDINDLADYDVWEYNNLEEKYVLVALDGSDYIHLEKKGWKLRVDHEASSQVALGVEPPDGPPFESGYHTVDEYYSSLKQLNNQHPQLTELVN